MELEKIKSVHCRNEELIKKLKIEYKKIRELLKISASEIKNLEEYKKYIKEETEENKDKLINIDICKMFVKLKNRFDILKQMINEEETKCSEKDFEEANRKLSCNHIFYKEETNTKKCVKCGLSVSDKEEKNECNNIGDLKLTYLYIDLFTYYKVSEKKYQMATEILQNEPLEHLQQLTADFLRINPNIQNDRLLKKLEIEVSKENTRLIEAMFGKRKNLNNDIKKRYNTYKKILKNKTHR